MTTIILTTVIDAPIQRCFDLSRSVKLHLQSTDKTKERVVAGRTNGLFELNDSVTWEAVHFGMKQRLATKITRMNAPLFFEDVMTEGAFKSMRHEHHFEEREGKTYMSDVFQYEVPYGVIGSVFDTLILKSYMKRFLENRNQTIKETAERV